MKAYPNSDLNEMHKKRGILKLRKRSSIRFLPCRPTRAPLTPQSIRPRPCPHLFSMMSSPIFLCMVRRVGIGSKLHSFSLRLDLHHDIFFFIPCLSVGQQPTTTFYSSSLLVQDSLYSILSFLKLKLRKAAISV